MADDTASKKRKASSLLEDLHDGAALEMRGAVAEAGEEVAASDTSPVREWSSRQLIGTLESWRRDAKGKADAIKEVLKSACKKDPLSQEEFDDAVASMLSAGSFGPYGIPDLTRVQNAVDEEHKLRARLGLGFFYFQTECRDPITEIYDTLKEIRDILKTYAGWSNKTETGSRKTAEEDPNTVSESDYAEMMRGVHIPSPSRAERQLIGFLDTSQSIEKWWGARTPKVEGAVKRFSDFWSNLVEKSTKRKSDFFKQVNDNKVEPIVETVLQWEKSEGTNKKTEKMNFPTDSATEKEAVQPILGAMLRSLSQIPDDTSDDSACRSDQRRERYMPPTISRPRRFVDFESPPLSPLTPVLLSQEMSLMKEVKNVRRKNQSAEAMHAEVSKQMCGHLAKRALIAFDIGDVGIDCRSVGVIITPVYIQVISLSLQHMGTANAELRFERTPLWPLVTEAAFGAFVQQEADKAYLRPQLFQPGVSPSADTPKGMHCLWELLHTSDVDLGVSFFGAEKKKQQATFFQQNSSYSVSIGPLLGSGSHGIVYGVDGDGTDDLFVKASLVGEVRYLERERTALSILAQGKTCQHIPVVKKAGSLRYNIRDTVASVPAMLISPKGVSALQYLSTAARSKSFDMFALWSQVSEALMFAHEKNVCHLDVSPRNIVVAGDRFVLVDWGCSAFNNESVVGFRGSLAFAHAQVHSKTNTQKWKPEAAHDKASLVFTVCALWEGNPVPWSGFTARLNEGAEAFKHRRDHTEERIADLFQAYLGGEHDKPIPTLFGEKVSTDRTPQIKTFIRKWIEGA